MSITLHTIALAGVIGLVGIGIYGLLITRNLIKVVVALQILVKGILIAFILAGNQQARINLSQSMALTILVADTIVAVIALAVAVQVRRAFGSLDLKDLSTLRR